MREHVQLKNNQIILRKLREYQNIVLIVILFFALFFSSYPSVADADSNITAKEYVPDGGKGPGVIMLSGGSGLDKYRQFGDRLQKLGYYTLLFDSNDFSFRKDDECRAELKEVIAKALKSPHAGSTKVVVIGYSLGGLIAIVNATTMQETVSATITYYPVTKLIKDLKNFPERFSTPLYIFQGGKDTLKDCCTIDRITTIEKYAKELKKDISLTVYPEESHGFNLSGGELDDVTWKKTLDILKKHHPLGKHE